MPKRVPTSTLLIFLGGLLLGSLLGGSTPVSAMQTAQRLFGTLSTGVPIALQAGSDGSLKVVMP